MTKKMLVDFCRFRSTSSISHSYAHTCGQVGMDVLPGSYSNTSGWGEFTRGVAAWANRAVFAAAQVQDLK